jgi:hypothetical protein
MLISVVVTIVDGEPALERCLSALASQQGAPQLQVIVPYDDTAPPPAALRERFKAFTFLPLGSVPTSEPPESPRGQHELFDRRRAAGLAQASGDLVAILEDRGVPRADWAARFARVFRETASDVSGGAIENGVDRALNWAVYFCDFGRYQKPFQTHRSPCASDVNVCYTREAIASVRSVWRDRYHEPLVHGALASQGRTIVLSPDPVVDEVREGLRLSALCQERYGWGRLYAEIRLRGASGLTRALLAGGSVLLPALLFARFVRDRMARRQGLWVALRAAPLVFVLLCAWSAGEIAGYVLTPVDSPRQD